MISEFDKRVNSRSKDQRHRSSVDEVEFIREPFVELLGGRDSRRKDIKPYEGYSIPNAELYCLRSNATHDPRGLVAKGRRGHLDDTHRRQNILLRLPI